MSRRIGIAAAIWGISVLLSRAIGLIREAVIGRVLGGGAEADAYWTAFVLPDFLNYLLAGGAIGIVFIPIFSGYLAREDEPGAWRVFSTLANGLLLGISAAVIVGWLLAPRLAPWLAPGFDAQQTAQLVRLTRIMLPAQIFHLVGGLLSATLQARDQHALPAMATLGYAGTIVAAGLIFGPTVGAEAFAWGVLLGSALGPFGLPLYGCLRQGLGWRLQLEPRLPEARRYIVLTLPIMLAFSVIVADDWLIKRYGSLVGEGTVSQLQYAKTLMKVPMGVFGLATGAAAYPTLARLVSLGQLTQAYDTLIRACRMMLVLAFASQAALTVAGTEIAIVIWGTRRFQMANLEDIGLYTGAFCLALAAWSANTLISRGFYAQQQTWLPSLLGTAVVLVALPLYPALSGLLGGLGLALASSLAISSYVILLAVVLRRRMAGPHSPRLWPLILRMVPAVGAGIAGGNALDAALDLPALLRGGLSGSLAILLTLLVASLLGVPEVGAVLGLIRERLRRRLGR